MTLPATTPLRNVTCCGLTWSIRDVTLLSSPQQAHAPTINSAPRLTVAPGSHTSSTPAAVTSSAAAIMLPPEVLAEQRRGEHDRGDQLHVQQQRRRRCRGVHETCGQQRRTDRAARDDRHRQRSPVTRAAHRPSGRRAIHHGETAIAAPRYSSPASTSGFMSSAMTDAAGVDAPNSTAASAQLRTPDRVTTRNGNPTARSADLAHAFCARDRRCIDEADRCSLWAMSLRRPRIGLLFRGVRSGPPLVGRGQVLSDVFVAFGELGVDAAPVVYSDDAVDEVRTKSTVSTGVGAG